MLTHNMNENVTLLLLLKDKPSFNEIGVGTPSLRNVSMGCGVRTVIIDL